jgi:hypothetical protein
MTVEFKFDYVLNLHDRNVYMDAIEKDGVNEEVAIKNSLRRVDKQEIKAITKSPDGYALILMKKISTPLKTVEDYDNVVEVIQKANLAVDIMQQEKVYIFDDFEVDDDELTVTESWSAIREEEIVL